MKSTGIIAFAGAVISWRHRGRRSHSVLYTGSALWRKTFFNKVRKILIHLQRSYRNCRALVWPIWNRCGVYSALYSCCPPRHLHSSRYCPKCLFWNFVLLQWGFSSHPLVDLIYLSRYAAWDKVGPHSTRLLTLYNPYYGHCDRNDRSLFRLKKIRSANRKAHNPKWKNAFHDLGERAFFLAKCEDCFFIYWDNSITSYPFSHSDGARIRSSLPLLLKPSAVTFPTGHFLVTCCSNSAWVLLFLPHFAANVKKAWTWTAVVKQTAWTFPSFISRKQWFLRLLVQRCVLIR